VQQWAWADFKRPKNTKELTDLYLGISAVPVGAIMMWAGAIPDIPDGWALCDGSFDTPDLRSRFVVGYNSAETDYNAIGKTGGAKQVTLTEAQMPEHNHTGTTNSGGSHTHTYQKSIPGRGYATKADDYPHSDYQNANTNSSGSHSHTLNINDAGGGEAHENRPPYYTIAFIQFKGL
jgi:microcystin-dependent protein